MNNGQGSCWKTLGWFSGLFSFFIVHCALFITPATAHPMPNSVVLLNVHADRIDAEVQIPLSELQAALGHAVNDSSGRLVSRLGPQLRNYLTRHIRPQSTDGRAWSVSIGVLSVQETQNPINGVYRELTAQVRLIPPAGADIRQFVFRYDAVLHQVVTHKILVSVRQDWAREQVVEDHPAQVGVIELDIVNNRVLPLPVSLETGSVWTGFRAMVKLGIRHISEGTDHLLFLLVLLLPAPLLVTSGRWSRFGGVRYSLRRLLLIVTDTKEARMANQALIDLLNTFAAKRQATTAQIALAWVLAQKPWIVPIPGTTKLYRLTENNGAAAIHLTAEELQEIEEASAQIDVVGTRYTEQMEKSTGL